MEPKLTDGDFVLLSRFYFRLRVGDLVVVDHPHYDKIVKRIQQISADKKIYLSGENGHSVSSEKMGWIPESSVVGKVVYSIRK